MRHLLGHRLTSCQALFQRLDLVPLSPQTDEFRESLHETGKSVDSMYRTLLWLEVAVDNNNKNLKNEDTV
jgi:hypothetical protein